MSGNDDTDDGQDDKYPKPRPENDDEDGEDEEYPQPRPEDDS